MSIRNASISHLSVVLVSLPLIVLLSSCKADESLVVQGRAQITTSGSQSELSLRETRQQQVDLLASQIETAVSRMSEVRLQTGAESDESQISSRISAASREFAERLALARKAQSLMLQGDEMQALTLLRKSVDVVDGRTTSGTYAAALRNRGELELLVGDATEGLRILRVARDAGYSAGNSQMIHAGLSELYWAVKLGRTSGVDAIADQIHGFVQARNSSTQSDRRYALERDGYDDYANGLRLMVKGDHQLAIAQFRKAIQSLSRMVEFLEGISRATEQSDAAYIGRVITQIHISIVEANRLIGSLSSAEIAAQEAIRWSLSRKSGFDILVFEAVAVLGEVLDAQGRSAQAIKLGEIGLKGLDRYGAPETSIARLRFQVLLGSAYVAAGDFPSALRNFDEVRRVATSDSNLMRSYVDGSVRYGFALFKAYRYHEALILFDQRIRALVDEGAQASSSYARTTALRALTLHALGRPDEARQILPDSVARLLRPSASDPGDVTHLFREVLRRSILESSLDVMSGYADLSAEDLFVIAESARLSSVDAALSAYNLRQVSSAGPLAEAIRAEQDATQSLTLSQSLLSNAVASASPSSEIAKLREEVSRASGLQDSARRRISASFPNYSNLLRPRPSSVSDVRSALQDDEALVSVYRTSAAIYLWVVSKNSRTAFHKIDKLEFGSIDNAIKSLRSTMAIEESEIDRFPDFDAASSHKLYQVLLGPVASEFSGAKTLIVVPHGFIAGIPFHVLLTKDDRVPSSGQLRFQSHASLSYLIKSHAIVQAPSASSVVQLRSGPRDSSPREPFVGFGDPVFNDRQLADQKREEAGVAVRASTDFETRGRRLALRSVQMEMNDQIQNWRRVDQRVLTGLVRLPETRDEVLAIANIFKADARRDVFLGLRANEEAVRTGDFSRKRVVLFATHGLMAGELPGLAEPALALSSSRLAGTTGDGLLTSSNIMAMKLNADWVLLSACNSAAADESGAEAVSGLGRAFFYAGARSVLATSWSVESTSAQMLTTETMRRQAEFPSEARGESLRQAMLSVMASKMPASSPDSATFSFAHPMFWAAYSLYGDPGLH